MLSRVLIVIGIVGLALGGTILLVRDSSGTAAGESTPAASPIPTPDTLRGKLDIIPTTQLYLDTSVRAQNEQLAKDTCAIAKAGMPLDANKAWDISLDIAHGTSVYLVAYGARMADVFTDEFCPEIPRLLPLVLEREQAEYGYIPQKQAALAYRSRTDPMPGLVAEVPGEETGHGE